MPDFQYDGGAKKTPQLEQKPQGSETVTDKDMNDIIVNINLNRKELKSGIYFIKLTTDKDEYVDPLS